MHKFTQVIGPAETVSVPGSGYISISREGTFGVADARVVSTTLADRATVKVGPAIVNRAVMDMDADSMRFLANFLNSAADAMDRGLAVVPEAPYVEPVLLAENENGEWFYTGDLSAAKTLAALDREPVVKVHPDNHWTVDLCDGIDEVAEFGAGRTEEEAWRYALGAYFGPADSEYDEYHLMRALARGSWSETSTENLALPPAVSLPEKIDLLDDPWRVNEQPVDVLCAACAAAGREYDPDKHDSENCWAG